MATISIGNGLSSTPVVETATYASKSPFAPRVDSIQRKFATQWLALDTYHYTDQDGQKREWDVAVRTTKAATASSSNTEPVDAVVIIPILRSKKSNPPHQGWETILVQQFRPPMKQATLEFPAGLIDQDESVMDAALRELREETGYVGESHGSSSSSCCEIPFPQVSRAVTMSPGMSNETVHIVLVEVDLDNPKNCAATDGNNSNMPQQELEDGEHCTVVRLPLSKGLLQVLDDKNTAAMPIMGLYMFALGLEFGSNI